VLPFAEAVNVVDGIENGSEGRSAEFICCVAEELLQLDIDIEQLPEAVPVAMFMDMPPSPPQPAKDSTKSAARARTILVIVGASLN
jgi:hypothetical protein